MDTKTYTFEGTDATVTWDKHRCIHFAACVHGLPDVFDPDRRPWIKPEEARNDALLNVIQQCPTGALHLRLADGTDPETTPADARVIVDADGPLYVRGDVTVETQDGEVLLRDTRIALCRCGLSENKPLCDGSHADRFTDPGALPDAEPAEDAPAEGPGPAVTFKARMNGPLVTQDAFTIIGSNGERVTKPKGALCRCGASKNKPYCDGTHREIGFEAP